MTDHTAKATTLSLPSGETIGTLKKGAIWDGGEKSYPPSSFTLSHNGQRLRDDITLGDLAFIRGESDDISIEMDTFNVVLEDFNTKTTGILKSQELRNKDKEDIYGIIKEYFLMMGPFLAYPPPVAMVYYTWNGHLHLIR